MIQFDFSVNSAIRDIFIQFQLAVGQSHFAVVTVENELFTWAVSMKFSSNSKYFFFLLVTSSNRRLFVTQISDFFCVNIGMGHMCEHLYRKYFLPPNKLKFLWFHQLN